MKLITYLRLGIISFILITSSCRKHNNTPADNPYGLPNATQTGANIFACRINGQNFVAYNNFNHIGASITNDSLLVQGVPLNPNYFEGLLLLVKDSSFKEKIYNIDTINTAISITTDSTCLGIVPSLLTVRAISGSIQLTRIDTTKKIVSGLFNCIIPMPSCDTLQITNGRFDIKLL